MKKSLEIGLVVTIVAIVASVFSPLTFLNRDQ